ncbi:MAG: aminotransferase class V-fold PLP-dependent enzyme [Ruminococcaceae bacterium]|nr:aminotransferase class V-fold PLP-dependent enzyme [Oscillospiraceae bacterium]
MIYLDNGATSFCKPPEVYRAMYRAIYTCANPGRGGYAAAMEAGKVVFQCREAAAGLFDCQPEQVVFTSNCTHGLNIGIHTLVRPGAKVLISGFEHNAVTRPLKLLGAEVQVAGRRLFDWEDTLSDFEVQLRRGVDAAVFTHVSNVFGYILPVEEMAALCRKYGVPFIIDAAQSAGMLPVSLKKLGADFIAMPGHKGLLGPQGTGILLCNRLPKPWMAGGTGSESMNQEMPEYLPDRAEAGTLNVPGISGLEAGLRHIKRQGVDEIGQRERYFAGQCIRLLEDRGFKVFSGEHQSGTVSFLPQEDCEELAHKLGRLGIAVRAGLHCAPLAHESAGTKDTGTVRISFGHDASYRQIMALKQGFARIMD